MIEQWNELKASITELRDNGGTGTQQDVCEFLVNMMDALEKQMQEPERICVAKVTLTDEQVKEAVEKAKCEVLTVLSAEPEITMCKDCIYYDPPHIEKDGQRYEYKDMPPEAFDPFTKKYVSSSYGINVGGRCCRDYERGYSEDKRVYVPETNYCGRAERKEDGVSD
jgi:hypothetical protein